MRSSHQWHSLCAWLQEVRAALRAHGHEVVYRPKYSPDMGFVELGIAHVKGYMRTHRHTINEETLDDHIDSAILALPPLKAHMRHCGY